MAEVSRAFDENNGGSVLHRLPHPIERHSQGFKTPWTSIRDGEMPPMMFQLLFRDGHVESYSFSDIREVHCRDAGLVKVMLLSLRKLAITFEGRHLHELANLFCVASLRSVREADDRDLNRPENAPEVNRILVEEIDQ